ncbi:MAG TPA: hypothetical protein VIL18_11980 [Longimicrobiales bacterium]
MFDSILEQLAPEWREIVLILASLVSWIPEWQARILGPIWQGLGGFWASLAGWLFLLLPAALLVAAMWTTMLSTYTLPFRSGRIAYLRALAFGWWDAGRAVWIYWVGFVRLGVVLVGHLWGLVRFGFILAGRALREMVASPFAALDWTARRYFKPGVPWVAFLMILAWSALEAGVFTFTLRPTLTEVLHDLTGTPPNPMVLTPILYALLFMLIAGSFACIQVVAEAFEQRKFKGIAQMLLIELFVMFFEVMFLYRELIDAITPWIAQQTGEQFRLGLFSTLALACFGWLGIRGMTWFLFGRFGTPALLAVLSRQTLSLDAPGSVPPPPKPMAAWSELLAALKAERDWFRQKADELVELLVLPVLQLLAVALNFVLLLVASEPAFALPFKNLDEAMVRMRGTNGKSKATAGPVRGSAAVVSVVREA